MKTILFIVIVIIILKKAHSYIYIQTLKNNWKRYILFSLISSIVLTASQFYVSERWLDLKENLISAFIMVVCTFAVFILFPIFREKVNNLSK